jgi:SpoVK/Ycf46/Vps4 family AAA+-type ATPase
MEDGEDKWEGMGGANSGAEEMSFNLMPIGGFPFVENVVGTAREFLDDFLLGLEAEGVCNSMGVDTTKTYLLEGNPGTGKTLSIKALNNELNKDYFAKQVDYLSGLGRGKEGIVPTMEDIKAMVFEYSIGRYGTKFINEGSRIMQQFFDTAKSYASYGKKVIVTLDEADAVMGTRKGSIQTHSEDRKVLETLMKNLQITHDTPNMYAILMTNLPEACDEASLRAGRIDRRYHFTLPKPKERMEGFQHAINEANRRADYQVARRINYDELADISEGFNYADIAQSVNTAIRKRALEVAKDRTDKIIPAAYVTHKRLKREILEHKVHFHKEEVSIGFQ